MSNELDLRSLHQPHEPDPGFVDALQQRLEAVLTSSTRDDLALDDGIETRDDAVFDLYPRTPATRSAPRRWIMRAALGAAAAVVLVAALAVIARRDDPAVIEPFTPVPVTNGWVAQSWESNIYLQRADGTGEEFLVRSSGGGARACPAFSPDGDQLMFGRNDGDANDGDAWLDVVSVAADGGEVTRSLDGELHPAVSLVATIPLEGVTGIPCAMWASDGRWAALGGGGSVWVVDTETAEVRELPGYEPSDLEWRPGTDELAITGISGGSFGDDNAPIDIYTVSTGEVHTLGDVEAVDLTWSPDGTTIAYSPAVPDTASGRSGITLIDADGTNPRPLTTDDYVAGHGIGVVWSPRGDQIAYQRERADCRGPACYERSEVVLVTATDTDPDNPIGTERAIPPVNNLQPSPSHFRSEDWTADTVTWSPDGTQLLYSAGRTGVLVVPVDGTGPVIELPGDFHGGDDESTTTPRVRIQEWQAVR